MRVRLLKALNDEERRKCEMITSFWSSFSSFFIAIEAIIINQLIPDSSFIPGTQALSIILKSKVFNR